MPGIFDWKAFPLSHIMISLQFLVIAAAVSLKPIAKGIADAFCLRPTPYSVAGISVLVNLAYTIVVASVLPDGFVLFNFPAALAVTAATAYEYALWLIERKCFDCISSDNGQLYALVGDFEGQRPFGDEPTQRAYRTDFVKNYFDRTGKRSKEYKYLSVLIPASVLAGLLAMAIVWIATGDGNSGGAAAMLVMGFALPVGVMGTFSLPLLAVILSLKGRGAIIGHSAADEYEKTRFVTFDETDLFPTIKTTYIDLKPSGNRNISEVLGKTSRLFRSIGGPLSRMVEGKDIRPGAPEAEITGIFDDGISAIVDSSEMLVGGARFMELKGVDLSAPRDHRDADPAGEILYVAIEGRLAARYYIKYLPDEDLVSAVNSLGDRGICVGLRTRNPGVNSRIIEARCPELKYKVYTIKSVPDEERELDSYRGTVDSGIVVKDRAAGLARPLAAAISLKKYYKLDRILRFVLAALGAVIFAATAIMGRITDISSALVAAYQLAGLIPPAVAAAILYLRNK